MNTEMKNAVSAADGAAQYDDKAKRLLGNKSILAHILVKTIDAFHGMNPKDVVSCIEGEPLISAVAVEPGLTNSEKKDYGQRIVGLNTENGEIHEGLIRFDIIFYVRLQDGLSQIIVNIEIQKDAPQEYDILNRAVFYASRMISSQKERDFVNTNYDDIKRVFTIWICLGMKENCMNYIHLTDDRLLGSYEWKGGIDLLNIVMIGIAPVVPEHDEKYELHRLLGTLLSMELPIDRKLAIIEQEYDIPVDDGIREDVNVMCNLSQGIMEKGMAKGKAEGIAEGMAKGKAEGIAELIQSMYKRGYTLEQIAEISEKSVEEVEAIIQKKEAVQP